MRGLRLQRDPVPVCARVAAITLSAASREAAICLRAMIIVAATVPKPAKSARTPAIRVCQS
jgi:hypothetical protein